MASTVINTREDLDAISGTIEHDVFMATLRGTLWRLEKDGKAEQFRIVEVTPLPAPTIDPITQSVMRDGGEFVGGRWQYKWRIDALSAEQIAANQLVGIKKQIANLEALQTPRLIREATLDLPDIDPRPGDYQDMTAKQKLAKIDEQIKTLKEQL